MHFFENPSYVELISNSLMQGRINEMKSIVYAEAGKFILDDWDKLKDCFSEDVQKVIEEVFIKAIKHIENYYG